MLPATFAVTLTGHNLDELTLDEQEDLKLNVLRAVLEASNFKNQTIFTRVELHQGSIVAELVFSYDTEDAVVDAVKYKVNEKIENSLFAVNVNKSNTTTTTLVIFLGIIDHPANHTTTFTSTTATATTITTTTVTDTTIATTTASTVTIDRKDFLDAIDETVLKLKCEAVTLDVLDAANGPGGVGCGYGVPYDEVCSLLPPKERIC